MTGDVYGLTVGGNQRMQTVGSSVGFSLGDITVQNLVTKGDVYGVYADHEGKTQNVNDVNLDDLTVTRLVSAEGKTYGLYIAENTAVNVDGNMQLAADEGIYAENTEFNWGGNSAVILGNVIFNNVTANFDTDKSDGNDNAALIQGQFHTELPDWIRGYSDKQKADVLALHARGFSSYRIAKILGISPGTCSKWVRESHLLRKQLDV